MPPKGSKKGAARKRGANLRKQAVSNQHKEVKKSVKKEPAPTHDANGLLIGSKEANWALLRASGKWYTYLDEQDRGEAEGKDVQLGSEEWVKMKTPQLAPPVLEETRLLSRVEWDFPTPQLSSSPPRRNKRKATDDDDVDPPATKRSRRGPVTTSGEGDTSQDLLDLLALPPARQGQRMAFGMGLPVLDTLPPRQRKKAATSAPTATIEEPSSSAASTIVPIVGESSASAAEAPSIAGEEAPPIVVEAPEVAGEKEASTPPPNTIAISTTSSALSSLGSRTPSPPPDLPPPSLLSPVEEEDVAEDEEVETPRELSSTTTTTTLPASSPAVGTPTTPGRKGARGSFPCSKCTKSFGRVEHLNRHVLSVHDKVKRFVCGGCGGRFSRKDNMRQHQGKCGLWAGMGEEGE